MSADKIQSDPEKVYKSGTERLKSRKETEQNNTLNSIKSLNETYNNTQPKSIKKGTLKNEIQRKKRERLISI